MKKDVTATDNPRHSGEKHHPVSKKDGSVVASMPEHGAPIDEPFNFAVGRRAFDEMTEQTAGAPAVSFSDGSVGGVPGVWSHPRSPHRGSAILYLHGGAYTFGTAHAYRHLAGQIAARTNVVVFVADYRLAPENVFPAAIDDAIAAYRGLVADGFLHIAIVGDSAGGGMALASLSWAAANALSGNGLAPAAGVAMSPWTDLALTGASMTERAGDDPLLTPAMLSSASAAYLHGHDPRDPLASPLYGSFASLPEIQIHVGMNEILLDDSRRYVKRARDAHANATVHVWEQMMHVFAARVGALDAAEDCLALIGSFLVEKLIR